MNQQEDPNLTRVNMTKINSNINLEGQPEIEETPDGTEYEDIGITKPFDPTLINILTRQMSLDTLIKRMREQEVDLAPDFQRAEVWKPTAKSRLIESLLIRIPLPGFYMDATNDDKWLVVDGLQRLSAIRDFVIKKTMHLQDLEFLSQFQGLTFDQLPRNYQRRIEETQVTVYQIEKGTPPEVKFNIFKRINTGGLPLSAQEIRHALNQGAVTSYLKRLADSQEFQTATNRGVSDKRMAARECVLRFLAFTLTPPEKYTSDNFDNFLSNTMATMNNMKDSQREDLAKRFLRAVKWSNLIFSKSAFRKPGGSHPVNKALFEVWTVAMDKQTDDRLEQLKVNRELATDKVQTSILNDSEFLDAISQGTGDIAKIKLRFSRFQKIITEALQ